MSAQALDRALGLLHELTAISSASGDVSGIREALDHLARSLTAYGWDTRQDEDALGRPGAPVLLAGDLGADRPLLLAGHIDTVLPACEPRRIGDRLVATGAIDMKGGLALLAGALAELETRGSAAPSGRLLAVVPDEEIGGPISARTMERLGAHARALWVLEPGGIDGEAETLVLGRWGLNSFSLRLEGKSAHAGNAPEAGRSALMAAADWSQRASQTVRAQTGAIVNLGRLVAGDTSFVEQLDRHAAMLGTARQVNIVPDCAVLDGEIRFLEAETGAAMIKTLQTLADEVAAEHEVIPRFRAEAPLRPLTPTPERLDYGRRAIELASRRGLALRMEKTRGGISFPNFLPEGAAIPVLDGLGPVGDGMHTREEWLSIPSLERRIMLLADLLEAEASGQLG